MDPLLPFFLPAILYIGFMTSYDDKRTGLIKNKYTMYAIAYTVLIFFFS